MAQRQNPVYTDNPECRDCYKCVRECPVKAIRVRGHVANIMPELCITCGHCVAACPMNAKKVRVDLAEVKALLRSKKPVYVSLAPSWPAEFGDLSDEQMAGALKALGFAGVSETALGAEQISLQIADYFKSADAPGRQILISTACPAVVDLVKLYYPADSVYLTPMLSPMLAHAKLLRREFGDDIGVVFIGPCVAKKKETDAHPELVNEAITFPSLRSWLEERNVLPALPSQFVPRKATDCRLYPIDGGMSQTVRNRLHDLDRKIDFVSVSGVKLVRETLEGLAQRSSQNPVFLELLACEGGCISGPRMGKKTPLFLKRDQISDRASAPRKSFANEFRMPIEERYQAIIRPLSEFSDDAIANALLTIGKTSKRDELNCGGCGYDTCRELARVILSGTGEPEMCVSFMRKLASNQARALMQAMPSGAVIVDKQMNIIECNENFAEIIGGDLLAAHEVCPGLKGVAVQHTDPFYQIFANVLETGNAQKLRLQHGARVLQISAFAIEDQAIVGGIVEDITQPSVHRAQIVNKAQEVIHKTLSTVQQIAFLLGENAAETEVLLNSIIESFSIQRTGNSEEPK